MSVRVRTVNDIKGLEEIRPVWLKLQDHPQVDFDNFFASVIKKSSKPHILVAEKNSKPCALLIGNIEKRRFDCKIGYKTLLRPETRSLSIIEGGILGNLDHEISHAFFQELCSLSQKGDVDVIWFFTILTETPLYQLIRHQPGNLQRDLFPHLRTRWRTTLPDNWEEYYKGRSSKTKRNFRKDSRRIEDQFRGRLEVRCYQRPEDGEQVLDIINQVSALTYHRALKVGYRNTEPERLYKLELLNKGILRVYALFVDGKPIAFWSGKKYKDTFYTGHTGYDPEFRVYHPGKYLIYHMIQQLCKDPEIQVLDFGSGFNQYKQSFADMSWEEASIAFYAPTIRGRFLNILRSGCEFIHCSITWTLDKLKILDFARRFIRNKARKG